MYKALSSVLMPVSAHLGEKDGTTRIGAWVDTCIEEGASVVRWDIEKAFWGANAGVALQHVEHITQFMPWGNVLERHLRALFAPNRVAFDVVDGHVVRSVDKIIENYFCIGLSTSMLGLALVLDVIARGLVPRVQALNAAAGVGPDRIRVPVALYCDDVAVAFARPADAFATSAWLRDALAGIGMSFSPRKTYVVCVPEHHAAYSVNPAEPEGPAVPALDADARAYDYSRAVADVLGCAVSGNATALRAHVSSVADKVWAESARPLFDRGVPYHIILMGYTSMVRSRIVHLFRNATGPEAIDALLVAEAAWMSALFASLGAGPDFTAREAVFAPMRAGGAGFVDHERDWAAYAGAAGPAVAASDSPHAADILAHWERHRAAVAAARAAGMPLPPPTRATWRLAVAEALDIVVVDQRVRWRGALKAKTRELAAEIRRYRNGVRYPNGEAAAARIAPGDPGLPSVIRVAASQPTPAAALLTRPNHDVALMLSNTEVADALAGMLHGRSPLAEAALALFPRRADGAYTCAVCYGIPGARRAGFARNAAEAMQHIDNCYAAIWARTTRLHDKVVALLERLAIDGSPPGVPPVPSHMAWDMLKGAPGPGTAIRIDLLATVPPGVVAAVGNFPVVGPASLAVDVRTVASPVGRQDAVERLIGEAMRDKERREGAAIVAAGSRFTTATVTTTRAVGKDLRDLIESDRKSVV